MSDDTVGEGQDGDHSATGTCCKIKMSCLILASHEELKIVLPLPINTDLGRKARMMTGQAERLSAICFPIG